MMKKERDTAGKCSDLIGQVRKLLQNLESKNAARKIEDATHLLDELEETTIELEKHNEEFLHSQEKNESVESLSLVRTMIDAIPDPTMVVDLEYKVRLANRAALDLAEITHVTDRGLTCYRLYRTSDAPCERPEHPCPLKQVMKTKSSLKVTHTHLDHSGKNQVVEVSAVPIINEEGKVARVIVCWKHLSGHKKLENGFRKSEEKYRQLVETLHEGIWGIDRDGYTNFVNPRMAEMLGYTVEEMMGNHLFSFMDEEGIEQCKHHLEKRKKGIKEWHDFEFVRKDGHRIHTRLGTSPILDDEGNYMGALAGVQDITEHNRAEEGLKWELAVNDALADIYTHLVSTSSSIEEISDIVLTRAMTLTGSTQGCVASIDPATGLCSVQACTEILQDNETLSSSSSEYVLLRDGDGLYPGLLGHALNTLQPFFTNEPEQYSAWEKRTENEAPVRRFLAVPVLLKKNLVGQIALADKETDYTERDLKAISRIADKYALALQRIWIEEEIENLAKFPSESPDPVLRIKKDGTLLYANETASSLLKGLGYRIGQRAPEAWCQLCAETLTTGSTTKILDIEHKDHIFSFVVVPVSESEYVNLYGRDVTERRHLLERLEAEKKRAEELAKILKKERDIIETIMENTHTHLAYLDTEFNFVKVNSAYAKGSGHDKEKLLGTNHFEWFPDRENEEIFEKVRESSQPVKFSAKPFEFVDQPERGVTYWDWMLVPVKGEEGTVQGLVLSLHDVTEKVRADQELQRLTKELEKDRDYLEIRVAYRTEELLKANRALQESQRFIKRIADTTPDMIYIYEIDTICVVYANRQVSDFTGYPSEDIAQMGASFYNTTIHPEYLYLFNDSQKTFTGIRDGEVIEREFQMKHTSGQWRWIRSKETVFNRDSDKKPKQILATFQDITERKLAEERIRAYQHELRSLASQLSLAEEKERRRIATALHDSVVQNLIICNMKMGTLSESEQLSGTHGELDYIREMIKQTIEDTRSLTFDLSSPILYTLGFEAAVQRLAEQFEEQHGISFTFETDRKPKRLSDDIRVILFQAVRELLVNIIKHAQAREAGVTIYTDDKNIKIYVKDDGVGFESEYGHYYRRTSGGFGLFNIRERLDHLGGHFEVKSVRGQGTRIILTAPLKSDTGKAGETI